jgi:DNA mismatch repair ATPase MutS
MARLARWISWAEVRHSPMLHGLMAAALAWNAVLLAGLDGWRRRSGPAVRDWFDALADAEALVALATLAHDNPDWSFPEPVDAAAPVGEAGLEGVALGHPLLAAGTRVANPVRLGAPGSLLMVSGSNMAGKTTLLRAIGANVLLAQAGGPVCATAMRWRPVRVRTSVRVHDALEAGVSLFLAELRRLRDVVAASDGTADERSGSAAPVLFLFDEVLHGTNSHDRREATRAVLARLAARGAVGVVTTHDLELADDPGLAPATTHVHFRERYASADGGPRMEFDYLARPGRATTTNALALLDLLGLGR